MKTAALLRLALVALIVVLAIVITSWVGSENNPARADQASSAGNWIVVTSTIQAGESLLYMFDAEGEILPVYAYYRRAGNGRGATRYRGDLEFLAGRHCKWDALYSQQRLFPYAARKQPIPSHVVSPKQLRKLVTAINDG
jgi:hypothetical protein